MDTEFLNHFETRLRQTLHTPELESKKPKVLLDASRHLALADAAKRMRPLLVDHLGEAFGLDLEERLSVATAAELIHTASLLHDDVVDDGSTRRNRPTVNTRWNNSVAVLSGDLVLCIAFNELHSFDRRVVDDAVELVADMSRSAMLEIQARQSGDWDVDDWSDIARGKTAALLAWATKTPAIIAGRPELEERIERCGHHLGMAFQMMDDVHDIRTCRKGGELPQDLMDANPSLPVALARQRDSAIDDGLRALWSDADASNEQFRRIGLQIADSGAIAETVERIDCHLDCAIDALGTLANEPGARKILSWSEQLRHLANEPSVQP